MKPMTPPPAPYCVVASWVVIGAAEQRAARQSWRKRLNMVMVNGLVGMILGLFLGCWMLLSLSSSSKREVAVLHEQVRQQ